MSRKRDDDDSTGEGRGFLSRWSDRKRRLAAQQEHDAEPDAVDAAMPEDQAAVTALSDDAAGAVDPDALTQEEIDALPPVESVTTREELQQFLRKGVPRALKNAAMRRMWAVNPAISNYLDPARDYAYDWNTIGGVPGNSGSLELKDVLSMVDRIMGRPKADTEAEDAVPAGQGDDLIVSDDDRIAPSSAAEGAEQPEGIQADDSAATPALPTEAVRLTVVGSRPKTFVADGELEESSIGAASPAERQRRSHGGATPE